MEKKYIIGLDEGTTNCRCVVFDVQAHRIIASQSKGFKQYYPKSGWVEHDAEEIFRTQTAMLNTCIKELHLKKNEVFSMGITNQRESVVMWQKSTGQPVHKSIVWQCRRTADYCKSLPSDVVKKIKEKTGLIVDAYFSATKIKWLLENVPETRSLLDKNDLCVGTMDTFLAFKLTRGEVFATDTSNASRTMLFNINTLKWDKELLDYFGIPASILPKVVNSSEIVGNAKTIIGDIAIASLVGDQQASLFGQGCYEKGMAKNTYGTGCFLLTNSGSTPLNLPKLLTTVAWTINDETTYALEGSIFNAGSTIDWLVNNLGLISSPAQSDITVAKVKDNEGVYMVPAFTGLGAPYWNPYCHGIITGLTRATTKSHIVRAGQESMAYNTLDIINYMKENGVDVSILRCDGGVTKSNFLMQFQADMLNKTTTIQNTSEITVLGAIFLAGLASGAYKSVQQIAKKIKFVKRFSPKLSENLRQSYYAGWKAAVKQCLTN